MPARRCAQTYGSRLVRVRSRAAPYLLNTLDILLPKRVVAVRRITSGAMRLSKFFCPALSPIGYRPGFYRICWRSGFPWRRMPTRAQTVTAWFRGAVDGSPFLYLRHSDAQVLQNARACTLNAFWVLAVRWRTAQEDPLLTGGSSAPQTLFNMCLNVFP